jgi:hypothetical protein
MTALHFQGNSLVLMSVRDSGDAGSNINVCIYIYIYIIYRILIIFCDENITYLIRVKVLYMIGYKITTMSVLTLM